MEMEKAKHCTTIGLNCSTFFKRFQASIFLFGFGPKEHTRKTKLEKNSN